MGSDSNRATREFPRSGVYAITDTALCAERGVVDCVRSALEGGAVAVQYRDKGSDTARRLDEASALAALCRKFDVPLIVNDDIELALRAAADGVHLGRDDDALESARKQLPLKHIGASCYGDLARMHAAIGRGADHVAFGAAFPSATKPTATPLPPAVLRRAAADSPVPVIAIGGIDLTNAHQVCATGVRLLAIVSAVFAATNIAQATRELSRISRTAPGPGISPAD